MTQDRDLEKGLNQDEIGPESGSPGGDAIGGSDGGGYGGDSGYAGGTGDYLGGAGPTDLGGDVSGGTTGDIETDPAYGGQSVQTGQAGGETWGDRTGADDPAGDADLTGEAGYGAGSGLDRQEDRGQGI